MSARLLVPAKSDEACGQHAMAYQSRNFCFLSVDFADKLRDQGVAGLVFTSNVAADPQAVIHRYQQFIVAGLLQQLGGALKSLPCPGTAVTVFGEQDLGQLHLQLKLPFLPSGQVLNLGDQPDRRCEVGDRFVIGRPGKRHIASLAPVPDGFLHQPGLGGMMRKQFRCHVILCLQNDQQLLMNGLAA